MRAGRHRSRAPSASKRSMPSVTGGCCHCRSLAGHAQALRCETAVLTRLVLRDHGLDDGGQRHREVLDAFPGCQPNLRPATSAIRTRGKSTAQRRSGPRHGGGLNPKPYAAALPLVAFAICSPQQERATLVHACGFHTRSRRRPEATACSSSDLNAKKGDVRRSHFGGGARRCVQRLSVLLPTGTSPEIATASSVGMSAAAAAVAGWARASQRAGVAEKAGNTAEGARLWAHWTLPATLSMRPACPPAHHPAIQAHATQFMRPACPSCPPLPMNLLERCEGATLSAYCAGKWVTGRGGLAAVQASASRRWQLS